MQKNLICLLCLYLLCSCKSTQESKALSPVATRALLNAIITHELQRLSGQYAQIPEPQRPAIAKDIQLLSLFQYAPLNQQVDWAKGYTEQRLKYWEALQKNIPKETSNPQINVQRIYTNEMVDKFSRWKRTLKNIALPKS